jgi:hypothetical protein
MTTQIRWLSLLVLLALAACGGGGGGAGTSPLGSNETTPPASGGTVKADDIALALSTSSIANSGSVTVTATVTAVDSNRNTVSGIPVTLKVDNEATVQVSGTATDTKGVVTGAVGIGANKANRTITVTATSGTLTKQATFQVVGTKIAAVVLPAVVAPGAAAKVQYNVTDSTGGPLAGQDVVVSGPNGTQVTGKTNANGFYEFPYTAPQAAGNLEIRSKAAGVESLVTVFVQAGPGVIPNAEAGSARSASVSVNPSVVTVNTGDSTNNRAEVRALFVGNANQPIKNIRVRFDLAGDTNNIGGTFTSSGVLLYTNENGVAQSSYIPGSRFSPTDGVTVRACWDYADFPANTCPNADAVLPAPRAPTAKLTVISDALSVTIGTDNLIVLEDLVYVQRYIIQVNDSSGLAKPDALVSPLLDLPAYYKGFWVRGDTDDQWKQVVTTPAGCESEDLNRNGVLETYSNGQSEDANGNRQLDPRKADAVVSVEGSNRTNAAGQLKIRITYPRNVGSWLQYNLTVAATGVAGTEGRASFSGLLEVPETDVKATAKPPFVVSPYGTASSGTQTVSLPGLLPGSPPIKTAVLCTNPN